MAIREPIMMIKDNRQARAMKEYLKSFESMRDIYETEDDIVYSILPIYLAIKYDIIISEFIFHPILVRKRKFYEYVQNIVDKENIINAMTMVLEYELTNDENFMSNKNVKTLIKARKKLLKEKETN